MVQRSPRRGGTHRDPTTGPGRTRRRLLGALGAGVAAAVGGCLAVRGQPSGTDERPIERQATVRIDGEATTIDFEVPADRFAAARAADASVPDAAAAARDASFLDGLAGRLRSRSTDEADALRAARSLVTGLEYVTDADSTGETEYVRHPAETLVAERGDCDDKAVLLSALLSRPAFGYRTGLLMPHGHCATLVARADLPAGSVAPDPLTVTLRDTEFVYVEAVGTPSSVRPGEWAESYGTRRLLAAYRRGWYVLDGGALFDSAVHALDSGEAPLVSRYL